MAAFASCRYLLAFFLMSLYLKAMDADPNLTFSFKSFGKGSNFESEFGLYGDAKVAGFGNASSVEIGGSRVYSAGRSVCKKPFSLVDGKSRNLVSFSNYFVFSMSKGGGDGLAFVMLPYGSNLDVFDGGSMGIMERKMKFLGVEFDTRMDVKYGDVNGNHVGLDVDSPVSVKVANLSSINLVLNSGEKLQSWIDYEASGKRLEVRLSKLGHRKPLDPLLSYPIDLSKMWKDENVLVGLSSSSGNSSQKSNIYSWSFKSRMMPHWMHSEPMNPDGTAEKGEELKVPKRSDCALRIAVALVFGTGCGALGAFLVLFVWAILGNRRPIVPEEFVVKPNDLESKKFGVSVDKSIEDGKK